MNKNIGKFDKRCRIALAIGISIAFLMGVTYGNFGIVLLVIAIYFLVTSVFSFCPIYRMLGLSTKAYEQNDKAYE